MVERSLNIWWLSLPQLCLFSNVVYYFETEIVDDTHELVRTFACHFTIPNLSDPTLAHAYIYLQTLGDIASLIRRNTILYPLFAYTHGVAQNLRLVTHLYHHNRPPRPPCHAIHPTRVTNKLQTRVVKGRLIFSSNWAPIELHHYGKPPFFL